LRASAKGFQEGQGAGLEEFLGGARRASLYLSLTGG
jgi:hypothetical protein